MHEPPLITLKIYHRTSYRYGGPVSLGPHRLTLRPRESRDLRLISSEVRVTQAAAVTRAQDVFGNAVATETIQTMTDTLQNTSANPNNAESNNIPTRVTSISWVAEANSIWTNELFTDTRIQLAREARPMTNNSAPGVPAIAHPEFPA